MSTDQKQPNDEIESWLHQTLGDYSPEAPAGAWQRLAPRLTERKRRRRVVFWIIWSMAGASAVLASLHWGKNTASHTVPTAHLENTAAITADAKTFNQYLNITAPADRTHATPDKSGKIRGADEVLLNAEIATASEPLALESIPADSFMVLQTTALRPHRLMEPLAVKAIPMLRRAPDQLPGFAEAAVPIAPQKTRSPRFGLLVDAAPTLLIVEKSRVASNSQMILETHPRAGSGWQVGISITAAPIKNWRTSLGLQYLQYQYESTHSATLRLMDGVCLNPHDQGLKAYEFQYAIVSGGGHSNLTVRLQQQDQGSNMADDEPFTLDMNTIHRTTAWRIPLTLERRFKMGHGHGFLRGGAALNFSEKTTVDVAHYSEACQELCFQSGHMPAVQVSTTSKTAVAWLAGVGIERPVFNRAALRFEPFMSGQKGFMQFGLNLGLLFSN